MSNWPREEETPRTNYPLQLNPMPQQALLALSLVLHFLRLQEQNTNTVPVAMLFCGWLTCQNLWWQQASEHFWGVFITTKAVAHDAKRDLKHSLNGVEFQILPKFGESFKMCSKFWWATLQSGIDWSSMHKFISKIETTALVVKTNNSFVSETIDCCTCVSQNLIVQDWMHGRI